VATIRAAFSERHSTAKTPHQNENFSVFFTFERKIMKWFNIIDYL